VVNLGYARFPIRHRVADGLSQPFSFHSEKEFAMSEAWFMRRRVQLSAVFPQEERMPRREMTRVEVREILRANIGKRLRITFKDGIDRAVDIGSVDDEGFRHSGPEGDHPNFYRTSFEEVKHIHRTMTAHG
jgi:hypothetical protein